MPIELNKGDLRDTFVMLLVAQVWVASTVYLFLHPSEPTFVTWSSLCATMGGIYHWLCIRDDKTQDCR